MPDNENQTPQSGETPKQPSLREIAESAYDDIVDAQPDEDASDEPVDTGGRQRDNLGRFARAEPGEAEAPPEPPSPDDEIDAPDAERSTQPREGVAAEPPENWSQADKEMFVEATPKMKAWALRRHSEMEGDYQRRVQVYAQAAQFAQGVAPVFNEPRIAAQLQQWGLTPQEAVNQWGNFQLEATDPDPVTRARFILNLAERIGVPLNPAALTTPSQLALPPEMAKDPAIKFFADYLGKVSNDVQATNARQDRIEQASQQQREAEALRAAKWNIDSFADAKDAQGNLLHPDFDAVIDDMKELFLANPRYDLNAAYRKACRMNEAVWAGVQQREAVMAAKKAADQRAASASRLNVRGRTVPVTGTNGAAGPRTLRETIEAAADEIGI